MTTPFENYSFLKGQIGLSDKKKKLVAEIEIPAGPLGIEGVFQILNNYDFNIKILLATPIDAFKKVLIVLKLNNKEADFKITYNNLTAGFQVFIKYTQYIYYIFSCLLKL